MTSLKKLFKNTNGKQHSRVTYERTEQLFSSDNISYINIILDKKKPNRTMIRCQLKGGTSNNKSILIIVIYSTVKGQQEMIKRLSRSRKGQPININ